MAEAVMKKIVRDNNKDDNFFISSAAVSSEEIGSDVYPPAQEVLKKHGINNFSHKARKLTKDDYDYYDYIIVMDEYNKTRAYDITDGDRDSKIRLLNEEEIDDPWYTGDFEKAFDEIQRGCEKLYLEIINTESV